MPRNAYVLLPRVQSRLTNLGERLRQARLRRRFSLAIVAERAGISEAVLRGLERGRATCSLGALANVLFVLGFDAELDALARDDILGRKLQDLGLPTRARAPRLRRSSSTSENPKARQAGTKKAEEET